MHIQNLLNVLNSIKNLNEETYMWSRFQVDSFHYFNMTKLLNRVTRLMKTMNRANSKLQRSWEVVGPKIAPSLIVKYSKAPTKIITWIILCKMLCLGKIILT